MEKTPELKRYNIVPIRSITEEEKEHIAKECTKKMETMIANFNGQNMYERIKKANIYLAHIPEKFNKINYIVSNNSIYIRGEENIKNIDEVMFHEIFHYIQCNKEENMGKLHQMGICKFGAYKIKGLALNESAIQLIISIIFNKKQENNNYFGIQIKSIHNKYFPILCALLQQIVYVIGYLPLLKSLLENNNAFAIEVEKFAGKKSYDFILSSFDKMMDARDKIVENAKLINSGKLTRNKRILIQKKNNIYVQEIQNHFLAIQKLCYTKYFKPIFKDIKKVEDLEEIKKEIERYRQHVGIVNEKDEFHLYIQKQMNKANKRLNKHI